MNPHKKHGWSRSPAPRPASAASRRRNAVPAGGRWRWGRGGVERLEELRSELAARHPQLQVVVLAADLSEEGEMETLLARVAREAGPVGGMAGSPQKFFRISAARRAREAAAGFERGDAVVFAGRA